METHGSHSQHRQRENRAAIAVERAGVLTSGGGFTLQALETRFRQGSPSRFAFRILDKTGRSVTDVDVLHERRIHLVVVRRDFAHYQHLHPELGAEGLWSVELALPAAGFYRAMVDFSSAGSPATLGIDLAVPGALELATDLPGAEAAEVDGYVVELAAEHDTDRLEFQVLKDGARVGDLEPYLGALGHLVLLREGDLAYLHAHPTEGPKHVGRIAFEAPLPAQAAYRLFLEFSHRGRVRTARFRVAR